MQNNALALTIGLTFVCLGMTIYILKLKISPVKKLFYFDLSRHLIYILVLIPNIYSILNRIEPLIFNKQNLTLPPPGLATVEQWITWILAMSLTEFTVVGGGALFAHIFAVAKGSSTDLLPPLFIGILFVLILDYLWSYKDNRNARIIRIIQYSITLFLFILWTIIAFMINPYTPGALDYFIYLVFVWYWQFNPLFILFIFFIVVFSFWLPLTVTGYLIYKQWRRQEYFRGSHHRFNERSGGLNDDHN